MNIHTSICKYESNVAVYFIIILAISKKWNFSIKFGIMIFI